MGKGEQTRSEIIQKAAVLFSQKGYAGAAISDVMQVTGLEKGGIYRHFESKEQLALEAFDYAVQLANSRYLAALRRSPHALDRLRGIIDAFSDLQQDKPIPGGCPIMNTAIDSDDSHPALRERASEAFVYWHSMLEGIITRGIERSEVRPDADPAGEATRLIALMEGGLMLTRVTANEDHWVNTMAGLRAWNEALAPDPAK